MQKNSQHKRINLLQIWTVCWRQLQCQIQSHYEAC